jgi:hypothetical protein
LHSVDPPIAPESAWFHKPCVYKAKARFQAFAFHKCNLWCRYIEKREEEGQDDGAR